jgi:hypothetical protein
VSPYFFFENTKSLNKSIEGYVVDSGMIKYFHKLHIGEENKTNILLNPMSNIYGLKSGNYPKTLILSASFF